MVKKFKAFFRKLFPPTQEFKSVSFNFVIRIHKNRYNSRQYIFDTIRANGNRYSCFVEGNDEIFFSINDVNGKYFDVKSSNHDSQFIGKWIYLGLELIVKEKSIQMTILINGFEKARYFNESSVQFDFDSDRMIIGANHFSRLCGIFDVATLITATPKTMKTLKKNKNILNKNFRLEFYNNNTLRNYVSYSGAHYLILNKNTNALTPGSTKTSPKLKNGPINIDNFILS